MQFTPLAQWKAIRDIPVCIGGPCSAETEEQVFETCRRLKEEVDLHIVRAGIWKPRTRPGSFEGVGEKGLPWLKRVKDELGLKIATEVATPQHVELALKYEVDVLWIGARSTVNPFTVQEIADALQGVDDAEVIVKNPVNPDLGLWVGGIERIYRAGVHKIAALHRGFSAYEKGKYRNPPMWQIPIALKSKLPDIPLFCDPSHIGGARDMIYPVSQKAIDLNYDGLMVETHIDPDSAWSDAQQQVTPTVLKTILDAIRIPKPTSDDPMFNSKLVHLREKIDQVDHELIDALAARQRLVEQIGDYKKEQNISVFQVERWLQVFQQRPEWGSQQGMRAEFVELLYKLIHDESIRAQTAIMEDQDTPASSGEPEE